MKRLFIALLFTQFMFGQQDIEIQIFQGVSDVNRQKLKVMTTYDHFSGTSHLGLDLERFTVGNEKIEYGAVGGFVEFGYAFTNFKIPIEIMPLASYGWFLYDSNRWGQRLLFGIDGAYVINPNIKIHLLINIARERWAIDNELELGNVTVHNYEFYNQNGNTIFIGLSYNL